jgi:DNA-binding Lrp family transcriptional regulator
MSEAYVLINCTLGKEEEIITDLTGMDGISTINGVFGAYDIIVKVKKDTPDEMRSLITEKIRKLKHIRSTLALIVIDEQNQ